MTSPRNLELASFLKSRRKRLTPEAVGLPHRTRRRIASLRREEVAWLADVGITWYTWLEQGRRIKMASDTLDRISAALRLDASEGEYLRKLVHTHGREPAQWDRRVSRQVSSLVRSYTDGFAFVVGPRWDVLSWNDNFARLFGITEHSRSLDCNGLWVMFTDERIRVLFPDWSGIARRMVATFRVEYADYLGDVDFDQLIAELSARSPDFNAMWADVDVLLPTRWTIGEIRDPKSGRIRSFETVNLAIPDSPGQTLVFCVPADVALAANAIGA